MTSNKVGRLNYSAKDVLANHPEKGLSMSLLRTDLNLIIYNHLQSL